MYRVVIVEDEILLALVLRSQLEAHGIEVVGTALNGRAALCLCRATRPDAVLMDIVMPLMDGVEATRRIMAECPTRIVVLTALEAADVRSLAMSAGAQCFLAKPLALDEILAALKGPPRVGTCRPPRLPTAPPPSTAALPGPAARASLPGTPRTACTPSR